MSEGLKLVRGYPEYMLESIELVAKSRARRLEEGPPKGMSLEERERILQYHPDYAPGGKRPL
ncbi:MAG TPA: succinate dehydrogenase/fumarate reductase flavoprotein subunit, partial [Candidatus Acetothermia bacterium]|nr:succinate dehydrogenase/fumarate reductase flavoprotein subunit [Candidatus Acetothermia bacterium]